MARKYLIISTDYHLTPPTTYGGIERISARVYEYFKKSGCQVDIISQPGSNYHTYNHEDLSRLKLEVYDAILVYKYDEETLRYLDKPEYNTCVFLQNNYKPKLAFLNELKYSYIYVLSKSHREQFEENLGIRYGIVPNFIDMSQFSIKDSARNGDICSIGLIGQHKSPLACLKYAQKNNMSIDFYGPIGFVEEEKLYEKKFMKELDSYSKAQLKGELGDDQKNDILNSYKYFIFLPSLDKPKWLEPFGIAPLEAMACGCTVITHYLCGGHLTYCSPKNSIDYSNKPTVLNPQKVKESILLYDSNDVISSYYPH